MAQYSQLTLLLRRLDPDDPAGELERLIAPYLIDVWVGDYLRYTNVPSIRTLSEVNLDDFFYLFDTYNERLVAAWGISQGRNPKSNRDNRQARAIKAGYATVWGHAIAHVMGGGGDINLVRQFDQMNRGSFRRLENEAVAAAGALYFNYWSYDGAPDIPVPGSLKTQASQTPTSVDQGLIIPGKPYTISNQRNA